MAKREKSLPRISRAKDKARVAMISLQETIVRGKMHECSLFEAIQVILLR